jgi:drug/metabolite transporter (DMT)-like permease
MVTHPEIPRFGRLLSSTRTPQVRASIALVFAALLWSGNFVAGRALRADIDPLTLNLLRWSFCLLIFLPWIGAKAWRHRRVIAREWRLLGALGATGIAAFHTLVYQALAGTTAINALLMLSLTPAAILIGATLTRASRSSPVQWIGTLVSLLGACFLLLRGSPTVIHQLAFAQGDLWMLGAVVVWAAYSLLLSRRPADLPSDVALAASIVPAIVLLLVATLLHAAARPVLTPHMLWALVYIAVFASLIAFLLWSYGVNVIGPERAGQFVHLMPVFGAVLAMLFLGESIGASQWVGAAFVFGGIGMVQRRAPPP